MKRTLIAVTISSALALGTLAFAGGEHHGPPGMGGPGGRGGDPLEHLTKELNLTTEQQAQVAPIIEQAKPQIQAIHKEAMERIKAVMENASAQIRPLLNADQQTKLDAEKKAHEDMINAAKEMHEARQK